MTSDLNFFNCTQCGDCCKGFGGTYLTDMDLSAMAEHFGISIKVFKERYCAPSGHRWVLAQRADGFCIFWDQNCTIHAIKPRMCRQWPYIDGVLKDMGNWKIMSGVCPGIRTDIDENRLRDYICKTIGKSCGHSK